MSFDTVTGKLYAADVGQDRNTISREEVDRDRQGGNYGWVVKSGDRDQQPPARRIRPTRFRRRTT